MKVWKLNGQIFVKSTKHIHVFQRMNAFVWWHLVSFLPSATTSGQNCISYRMFCALCALMRESTEEWSHEMSACRQRSVLICTTLVDWWMQSHHDPPVTMVTLIENMPGERLHNLLLAATRTPQNVLLTHQRFHALIGRVTNRTCWQCPWQKDHVLAKCTCFCCHRHCWRDSNISSTIYTLTNVETNERHMSLINHRSPQRL